MAIFKQDYNGWKAELGDDAGKEYEDQLKVTAGELCTAINQENVSDRLFARIMRNRSKAHKALLEKVPAAGGVE